MDSVSRFLFVYAKSTKLVLILSQLHQGCCLDNSFYSQLIFILLMVIDPQVENDFQQLKVISNFISNFILGLVSVCISCLTLTKSGPPLALFEKLSWKFRLQNLSIK
jgi:hypothetical protein